MVEQADPEAVAVALVRSYMDPSEEIHLGERLQDMVDVPVSVGALVSPQFREYERIATTVLNAYLTPELAGYLSSLDRRVGGGRRLVMTSSGGLLPFSAASASRRPTGPLGSCRRSCGRHLPGRGEGFRVDHQLRHGRHFDRCLPGRRQGDSGGAEQDGQGQSGAGDPGANHRGRRWESGLGRRRRCASGGTDVGRCRSRTGRIWTRW